jgi:predicted GNAT family acetyltransferase
MKPTVVNNKQQQRYELTLDGETAVLEYEQTADHTAIALTHTYVPDALRNRGVAAALVENALREIENDGLDVVPLCPYVVSYMKRNEQRTI